ncbi:MAG: DUF4258 domain-containing protein [Deltaproteobacteria bacterium]|nr:DUF4258 domain-containing protein [Deltaproteobacteria bacterium]
MGMITDRVRATAAKKLLFLPHAIRQMNKPDRMITADEVHEVVRQEDVIEDYPEDPRGHSCLLRGETTLGRIVHVVCSPKEDYLAIITAYLPDTAEWDESKRQRRKGSQ